MLLCVCKIVYARAPMHRVSILLLVGAGFLSGCDRATIPPTRAPSTTQHTPPPPIAAVETVPAAAWGGQRSAPRFEFATHFSTGSYERFAAKSLYLDGLARQIAGATYTTQLEAIEIDFFQDDLYKRDGELVVLKVDAQVATAFASRYYVDITYPTDKINIDGFGRPEWGRSSLTVRADAKRATRSLTLREVQQAPSAIEVGTVQFRGFGDNDAVLLYFNPEDLQGLRRGGPGSMRMEDPDQEIEALVGSATEVMGQEYVLLSRASFNALRDAIPEQDIATELLASASGQLFTMGLGKYVFRPLFGAGAKFFAEQASKQIGKQAGVHFAAVFSQAVDGFERTNYSIRGRQIAARTLKGYGARRPGMGVRAVQLPERRGFSTSLTRNLNALSMPSERPMRGTAGILGVMQVTSQNGEVELLGVELPPRGTEERTALDEYLQQVLRARGAQFVRFQARSNGEPPRGVVFLSEQRMVLNVELLRQGLARFDARDPAVAATFPELAHVAQAAMRAGTGFAARWRDDAAYNQSLAPQVQPAPAPGGDVWGGLVGTGRGTPRRPDLAQCVKFVRRFEVLMVGESQGDAAEITRSVARGMRADLLKDCRERGVYEEIVCALNSRTMDELTACSQRGAPAMQPRRQVQAPSRP